MISKQPKPFPFCSYYLLKWLCFGLFVICIIVGLALLNTSDVHGQPSYTFSHSATSPSTYEEIVNDSTVTVYPVADLYLVNELIGETFWFYNLPFTFGGLTSLSFGPNGFLRVDNDSSIIIIDGANTQLSLIDSTSKVSYSIDGSPGNRLFRLQYKNVQLNSGPSGNFANFQIWYYQSTGEIEIHYGPRSLNNASGYTTANGPNVGIFYSDIYFTICYEKIWCTVNPANPVLNTASNYVFSALPGIPDDGAIFRFTPTFSVSVPHGRNNPRAMVFPNPSYETLTVRTQNESSETSKISIYDTEGRALRITFSNTIEEIINIESLAEGLYYCTVENINRKETFRFIKLD
ncbi:MAG: T9SS type A sorting domain-containing protein [Bacteroidia bacterium]|nr:T9SS type A sorting domain-containing protein [Bacteroidia bacterium]